MGAKRAISEEERIFLEEYKKTEHKYPKPAVTADIAIFSFSSKKAERGREGKGGAEAESGAKAGSSAEAGSGLQILLVKRKGHPCKDMFALPGGFVNPDETMDEAASRELLEETGVDCRFLEQVRTFSQPGRDPRGWTITGAYVALLDAASLTVRAGDDAKEAEWFDVTLEKEGGTLRLSLKGPGGVALHALLREEGRPQGKGARRLALEESEGLAFDHGLIIAHALLKLGELL